MIFKPGNLIQNSNTKDVCLVLKIRSNTPDSEILTLLIGGLVYEVYLPRWSVLWTKLL